MNKKIRSCGVCVLVLLLAISCVNCSGGGGGTPATTITPIATQLTSAKSLLASGDIVGAEAAYAEIIRQPSAANDAEARFGHALCDLILLIEKDPSGAILAGFGQEKWKTTDVFGSNGFLAMSITDQTAAKKLLPFYNISECVSNFKKNTNHKFRWYRCILSKSTAGYTEQQLASSLTDLMASIDLVISDLLVAIQTASANYTIPKELYSGDIDMSINHADMVQILAGLYMSKAFSDFANSWTFGIDLSTLVDVNGNGLLTKKQAVDSLNQQFRLRPDNRLVSARANLQNALDYSKQALTEVLAGSSGGILNRSSTNQPIYQEMYDMASSARNSLGGSAAIVDIEPTVTANLDSFFNSPPDIESDPFVLQGTRVKAVEAYWQQMINSACNFTIGTKGVKVFSAAVRQINRPYYQLFNQIMGHTYGRYRAGRGA